MLQSAGIYYNQSRLQISCNLVVIPEKYPKKSAILTAKKPHYKIHYFEESLLKDTIKENHPEGTGVIRRVKSYASLKDMKICLEIHHSELLAMIKKGKL